MSHFHSCKRDARFGVVGTGHAHGLHKWACHRVANQRRRSPHLIIAKTSTCQSGSRELGNCVALQLLASFRGPSAVVCSEMPSRVQESPFTPRRDRLRPDGLHRFVRGGIGCCTIPSMAVCRDAAHPRLRIEKKKKKKKKKKGSGLERDGTRRTTERTASGLRPLGISSKIFPQGISLYSTLSSRDQEDSREGATQLVLN
ncbi:hypothetical protein GGR52DRAFT_34645 [Hypoxylon sp. FL1284]|nr:hypothetical protein GGR52DRAFT_34645 [Hypoxylon sp. FL1284]